MERVLRRPQAQDDIDDIWNYIADDNIHAADTQIARWRARCVHLRLGLLRA